MKRLHAYRNLAGFLTIGYGHKILPSESLKAIDEHTAEQLLTLSGCGRTRRESSCPNTLETESV
jgi:GH24 family phage-related lysozyme (muramidase)